MPNWSQLNPTVTWNDGTQAGLQYGDFTATPTGAFLGGAVGDLPATNTADFYVKFDTPPAGSDTGFASGIFAKLITALEDPNSPSVFDGVELAVNNNGHLRPFVGSSGAGPDWALLNDGAWHHIQIAISTSGGAYGNGQVTATVDGAAQTPPYDIFAHTISDTRIVFGIFNNNTTYFTNDRTDGQWSIGSLRVG